MLWITQFRTQDEIFFLIVDHPCLSWPMSKQATLLAGLKALLSYNSLLLISFYGFNNRQRGLMNKKTSTAPNPLGLLEREEGNSQKKELPAPPTLPRTLGLLCLWQGNQGKSSSLDRAGDNQTTELLPPVDRMNFTPRLEGRVLVPANWVEEGSPRLNLNGETELHFHCTEPSTKLGGLIQRLTYYGHPRMENNCPY